MTVVHARVFFCLIPAFAALAVGFEQKRYNAISSQDLAAQLGLNNLITCYSLHGLIVSFWYQELLKDEVSHNIFECWVLESACPGS